MPANVLDDRLVAVLALDLPEHRDRLAPLVEEPRVLERHQRERTSRHEAEQAEEEQADDVPAQPGRPLDQQVV